MTERLFFFKPTIAHPPPHFQVPLSIHCLAF
jgi:hypothetical protein